MASIALLAALTGQLRMVTWKWFEIYELMASNALFVAPTRQPRMGIWMWFNICKPMAFPRRTDDCHTLRCVLAKTQLCCLLPNPCNLNVNSFNQPKTERRQGFV